MSQSQQFIRACHELTICVEEAFDAYLADKHENTLYSEGVHALNVWGVLADEFREKTRIFSAEGEYEECYAALKMAEKSANSIPSSRHDW